MKYLYGIIALVANISVLIIFFQNFGNVCNTPLLNSSFNSLSGFLFIVILISMIGGASLALAVQTFLSDKNEIVDDGLDL